MADTTIRNGGVIAALDQASNGTWLDADGLNHDDDSLREIAQRLPEGWHKTKLLAHAQRIEDAVVGGAS